MLKRKKSYFLAAILITISFFSYSAKAISEAQEKNIVKNCKKIRETLKSIQYADTESRTYYLPMVYDEILSNFIIPMNTRLLKNDKSDKNLIKIQEDYVETYRNFKTDFVTYSRSMEELLKINCESNPNEFYSQLEVVRIDRNYINDDIQKLDQLIKEQKDRVTDLNKEQK